MPAFFTYSNVYGRVEINVNITVEFKQRVHHRESHPYNEGSELHLL